MFIGCCLFVCLYVYSNKLCCIGACTTCSCIIFYEMPCFNYVLMYVVPVDSSFQKSSNSNEKKLYKYLKNELYPAVMPSVKVQCYMCYLVTGTNYIFNPFTPKI